LWRTIDRGADGEAGEDGRDHTPRQRHQQGTGAERGTWGQAIETGEHRAHLVGGAIVLLWPAGTFKPSSDQEGDAQTQLHERGHGFS
jgi:hypothetical protein